MSAEQFGQFLQAAFESCPRAIKPGASLYVCHSSSWQREFQNALEAAGFAVRCQIIWAKNTFAWGFGRYKFQHEPMFYCHVAGQSDAWYGDKSQSTLWQENKPAANRLHPTMKPVELIERALVNSSKAGDIVVDLFGGSGTTLIGCERYSRHARLSLKARLDWGLGQRPNLAMQLNDDQVRRNKTAPDLVDNYIVPLAQARAAVLSIEPRGAGETAPSLSNREMSYRAFTGDYESRLLYASRQAGTTLLGMRTGDVRRGVDFLRTRPEIDGGRISVIGHGSAGLPVLHAAALDDRIRAAAVNGVLASYSAIVENEIYTQRYSMFVPGALRKYDLPALAALVAPRPLLILNAVDEKQRPLERERAVQNYGPAVQVFKLVDARPALHIERTCRPRRPPDITGR